MTDCIFCRIAKGEAPSYKIFENEEFLAFLDIYPFNKGHTLVIPKKHYRWVWDYPQIGRYFETAGQVVNHFREASGKDWVCSLVWGTDVPHAHIQILPWPEKVHLNIKRGRLDKKEAKELIKMFSF